MAVPTTTALDVTTGPLAGGITTHLVGTGYTGTTGVTVGGTAATGVVVVDDTHLTIITPAKTAGAQAIVVTNATGPSTVNLSFTYFATSGTYSEHEGTEDNNYFMDSPINGAALLDGSLALRLDPWTFPMVGVVQSAKAGTGALAAPPTPEA